MRPETFEELDGDDVGVFEGLVDREGAFFFAYKCGNIDDVTFGALFMVWRRSREPDTTPLFLLSGNRARPPFARAHAGGSGAILLSWAQLFSDAFVTVGVVCLVKWLGIETG